ncbi:hypothetical protein ACEPAG_127 [Sanghuangporus baumii]
MSDPDKTLDDVKAAFQYFGVAFGASENAVRQKWRDMVIKWHPDKYADVDKEAATKRFREVIKTKELLDEYATNPERFPPGSSQRGMATSSSDVCLQLTLKCLTE